MDFYEGILEEQGFEDGDEDKFEPSSVDAWREEVLKTPHIAGFINDW